MIDNSYQTRTWEELKAETLARAERGTYPVFAITPDDAREALSMINDLDPDAWGSAWMSVGNRYFERAQSLEGIYQAAAAKALAGHPCRCVSAPWAGGRLAVSMA